jgi:hypothetical protein
MMVVFWFLSTKQTFILAFWRKVILPSSGYLNLLQVKAAVVDNQPTRRMECVSYTGSCEGMLANEKCEKGDRVQVNGVVPSQMGFLSSTNNQKWKICRWADVSDELY